MDALRAVNVPVLPPSRWAVRPGRRGAVTCRPVAAVSHTPAAGRPFGAARSLPGRHTLAAPLPAHSACSRRRRLRQLGPPLAKKGASQPAPEPVAVFDPSDDGGEAEVDEEEYDELRVYLLRQLLTDVLGDGAYRLAGVSEEEDVELVGVATCPDEVEVGDLFVSLKGTTQEAVAECQAAAAAGAYAVLLDDAPGIDDQVTADGAAAVLVPSAAAIIQRLATTFYEDPASSLTTVLVAGSQRQSLSVATLVQSILAATQQKVALLTHQAYTLGEGTKLTARGAVWEPVEEDPTAERACTCPMWLAPYRGKYEQPAQTPDVVAMQQLLAGCVDGGADTAVVAATPAALRRSGAARSRFDVVVYAGGGHGAAADEQADGDAVDAVFASLHDGEAQRAVLCMDGGSALPSRLHRSCEATTRPVTCVGSLGGGEGGSCDVYPTKIELSVFDTILTVATPLGEVALRTTLVGASAVGHIVTAVAVGVAMGVPVETIAAGIEAVRHVPGVMQPVDEGQPFAVIVDSARTPEELRATLAQVRESGAQNLITVVGATAGTDKATRARLGRAAHELSDVLIVTTDNPDDEDVFTIHDHVVAGFDTDVYNSTEVRRKAPRFRFLRDHTCFWGGDDSPWYDDDPWAAMQYQSVAKRFVIADRFHAIRAAIGMAGEGDAVVLAGKGAEDWQLVEGAKHWFYDVAEAKQALKDLPKKPKSLDLRNLPYRIADWPSEMNDFINM